VIDVPHFTEPALCAEIGGDAWFPEADTDNGQAAKGICRRCPAREQCLEYALEHELVFGIWGGLSTAERRRKVGLNPRAPVTPPVADAPGNRRSRRSLTSAEKSRIQRLTAAGQSAGQIAADLDVHARTVQRVRSELRAERSAA
jgi:hypothetical protein